MSSDRGNDLHRRLRFEMLLADISARFVSVRPEQVDGEIERAQRDICDHLGFEHSVVWQLAPEDPSTFILTHLIRDPGLRPPPARMIAREYFPWVQSQIDRNEIVAIPSTACLPPEATKDAESFLTFGIRSVLAFPLSAGGGPVFGVLSFESTTAERKFSWSWKVRMRVVADVFASALARKHAEIKLRDREARLSLAAQSANAGLWTVNPETGEIWGSEQTYRLLGLHSDELLDLDRFFKYVDPRDRALVKKAILSAMKGDATISTEYRVTLPDRTRRWLNSRGRRYSVDGNPPFVLMGVTTDITTAKQLEADRARLTQQLLQVQENECARIARELHDDLGQSIVLFGVQLHTAMQRAQERDKVIAGALGQLHSRLTQIAHRVSTISHQLHSSELEFLGLEGAAKRLCREIGTMHSIKVEFSGHLMAGKCDSEIELCLFRILQEALTNAAKHSGARNVRVHLSVVGPNVVLRVSDNGRGISQSENRQHSGLGLVSMAERVRLAGGTLLLSSKPGKGTTIEARVPATTKNPIPSRRVNRDQSPRIKRT